MFQQHWDIRKQQQALFIPICHVFRPKGCIGSIIVIHPSTKIQMHIIILLALSLWIKSTLWDLFQDQPSLSERSLIILQTFPEKSLHL